MRPNLRGSLLRGWQTTDDGSETTPLQYALAPGLGSPPPLAIGSPPTERGGERNGALGVTAQASRRINSHDRGADGFDGEEKHAEHDEDDDHDAKLKRTTTSVLASPNHQSAVDKVHVPEPCPGEHMHTRCKNNLTSMTGRDPQQAFSWPAAEQPSMEPPPKSALQSIDSDSQQTNRTFEMPHQSLENISDMLENSHISSSTPTARDVTNMLNDVARKLATPAADLAR